MASVAPVVSHEAREAFAMACDLICATADCDYLRDNCVEVYGRCSYGWEFTLIYETETDLRPIRARWRVVIDEDANFDGERYVDRSRAVRVEVSRV